jgi:hypothetical protein
MASADDRCAKARKPCIYLCMQRTDLVLRVVPLPEEKRVGKTWLERVLGSRLNKPDR